MKKEKTLIQWICLANIIIDFMMIIILTNWYINFTIILFTQLFILFYFILCFIYWKLHFKDIYNKKIKNESKN